MKKAISILIFMALSASFIPIKAQDEFVLSEEEQAAFKERIASMLDNFHGYLSMIGSKRAENTIEVKKSIIKSTLRLFIGDGESYTDINGNLQKAPQMQVSLLRNGVESKNKYPIKTYLNNLMYINYKKVTIERAETIRLSNLYKVGDHYEAVATFYQIFRGERGDGYVYSDKTEKRIKIYVYVEENEGVRYTVARFGDIDVVQTLPD